MPADRHVVNFKNNNKHMKKQLLKINNSRLLITLLLSIFCSLFSAAQDDSTAVKEEEPEAIEIVKLSYYSRNNSMQYLLLKAVLKKGKEQTPVKNKAFDIYLDSVTDNTKIASIKTDANGTAKTFLPPAMKEAWDALPQHTFIVMAGDEEVINDYSITKSKITIDTATADGIRSITVTVQKHNGTEWVPAAEVEMKIGIQRLGGVLTAGEEETYTTDSSGTVTVEVKNDSLPGDAKGNILLAVKVDDNETYGNLLVGQAAPWGVKTVADDSFFSKRTLWSTRYRTPFWLLFLAYTIVLSVWSTLIYLLFQLVKIKKIGKQPVA